MAADFAAAPVQGLLSEAGLDPAAFGPDRWPDADGDGVLDDVDNCPSARNGAGDGGVSQLDSDGDGWGDACDNCLRDPNPTQHNSEYAAEPDPELVWCRSGNVALWDNVGDACDSCPMILDHTDENCNEEYEETFAVHGLPRRADACDPDPCLSPAVEFRAGYSERPPGYPLGFKPASEYQIRFGAFGFAGTEYRSRYEPVRLMGCSCWDDGTGFGRWREDESECTRLLCNHHGLVVAAGGEEWFDITYDRLREPCWIGLLSRICAMDEGVES